MRVGYVAGPWARAGSRLRSISGINSGRHPGIQNLVRSGIPGKKPEEIWPEYYLKAFNFNRKALTDICEELANMWECTYFHRELRPGVREMLAGLKARGYRIGVISNNASLYNVFNVLEEYGIREYMEDVEVSSITGYRKPHPEIFRISMKQMQEKPENCVYVGDTLSRDVIGSKEFGFGKAVYIQSFLSAQKDVGVVSSIQPDVTIQNMDELIPWLDSVNSEMNSKS